MDSGDYDSIVDLRSLRDVLAREVIESGRLPPRPADRLSDGPGDGATCTVCAQPLSPQALGYELVFMQDRPRRPSISCMCLALWRGNPNSAARCRQISQGPMTRKREGTGTSMAGIAGAGDESPETLGDLLFADRTAPGYPSRSGSTSSGHRRARRDGASRLFERCHRIVFTLTMRIAQNRQTAEELTIDVFHDVWRRAAQYDAANGPVLGWILNQARSRAIDRVRHEQRRKRVNPFPDESITEFDSHGQDEALGREALPASCGRP